jgi:hypothetical protein
VVFNERRTDLDLAILSVVGTKDLGGEDLASIACGSPHICGAATRGPIAGFG